MSWAGLGTGSQAQHRPSAAPAARLVPAPFKATLRLKPTARTSSVRSGLRRRAARHHAHAYTKAHVRPRGPTIGIATFATAATTRGAIVGRRMLGTILIQSDAQVSSAGGDTTATDAGSESSAVAGNGEATASAKLDW